MNVVTNIREQLEAAHLETSPDFASVSLDESIEIIRKDTADSTVIDADEAVPVWQIQFEQIVERLQRNEHV